MKHTEIPWEINENNPINIKITQKNKGTIAILPSVFTTESGYEEMKANAHLIVAAPDLLEAVKDLRDAVQSAGYPHEAVKRAEAVIKKAEGRP